MWEENSQWMEILEVLMEKLAIVENMGSPRDAIKRRRSRI